MIVHCTLQLVRWEGTLSTAEVQTLLREEINQFTSDYSSQKVFQKDFTLQLLFPSLRLNLAHQSMTFSSLAQKQENSDTCQNNPILCSCIPAAHFCWESYEIHRHPVGQHFILHSLLSSHILDWLTLNHFQLYRYSESKEMTQAYLTSCNESDRQLVMKYKCESDQHILEVLYQPFISTSLHPPITPLLTLLEWQQRRLNRISSVECEEMISLKAYVKRLTNELKLNFTLFELLSELFNSVLNQHFQEDNSSTKDAKL